MLCGTSGALGWGTGRLAPAGRAVTPGEPVDLGMFAIVAAALGWTAARGLLAATHEADDVEGGAEDRPGRKRDGDPQKQVTGNEDESDH